MIHDRYVEELSINLNPLQTAGRTNAAARKAVTRYVDGYSVCDSCAGILHDIEKPPIKQLTADLCEFLGLDAAALTHGARESKFAVMHAICNPGDTILVDSNAHYTTYVAATRAGLEIAEVPSTGHPEFIIRPEEYAKMLDYVKTTTGKPAALALLTHIDGDYGNLSDAAAVAKVCREASVPLLLNTAYSSGRMLVNAREIGVDFIACSCHKSWACCGPLGIVGAVGEGAQRLFRLDSRFPKKNIELLGCTSRGANIMSLMAVLPHIKKRIENWPVEVENARLLSERLEALGEIHQLGEKPTNHDLVRYETPLFYNIGQRHRKRGYFLQKELSDRGITGIKSGQTRWFKISTYGYTREQVEYIARAFEEISEL